MDDGFASMHLSMGYVALSVGFSCAHNTMLLSVPKLARESGACMHGGNKKEKKKNPVEPKDFTMTAILISRRRWRYGPWALLPVVWNTPAHQRARTVSYF
jgi:hypothetical protein